jgi:hypothetical protein
MYSNKIKIAKVTDNAKERNSKSRIYAGTNKITTIK